jgi:hypothetical protein
MRIMVNGMSGHIELRSEVGWFAETVGVSYDINEIGIMGAASFEMNCMRILNNSGDEEKKNSHFSI